MGLGLDLSGVPDSSLIPDGTYPVVLNKAEVTPTKSGGTMIKVQFKITDGPQNGRVIFDQYNIENTNPQAVQIGLGQLRTMMKAFGHRNPNMLNSTEELLGLKGTVAVKTVDDGGAYGPQTRVRAYKPFNVPTESTGKATGTTQTQATANPFG